MQRSDGELAAVANEQIAAVNQKARAAHHELRAGGAGLDRSDARRDPSWRPHVRRSGTVNPGEHVVVTVPPPVEGGESSRLVLAESARRSN